MDIHGCISRNISTTSPSDTFEPVTAANSRPLDAKIEQVFHAVITSIDDSQSKTSSVTFEPVTGAISRPLEAKIEQVFHSFEASLSSIDYSQSKTTIYDDYHMTIDPREALHNALHKAKYNLSETIKTRNRSAMIHFNYTSCASESAKYIRNEPSFEKAVKFYKEMKERLKTTHQYDETNKKITRQRSEVAKLLLNNVRFGLLSESDAIKSYSKALDSIYTEVFFFGKKTEQALQKITEAIAKKKPNPSEDDLERLENLKEFPISDKHLLEDLKFTKKQKEEVLAEFKERLALKTSSNISKHSS